jgi:PKD repeat protein
VAIISGPKTGYIHESIYFNAYDSYDPRGDIIRYLWDFGDGSKGTAASITHRYSNTGMYNVSLSIIDNDGTNISTIEQIQIKKKNEGPTIPDIQGPMESYEHELCHFKITSSDTDDDPIRYIIDWDDGSSTNSTFISNGQSFYINHQWKKTDEYIITVEATDGNLTSYSDALIYIKELDMPIPVETEEQTVNPIYLFFFIIPLIIILLYITKKRMNYS